MKSAFFTAFLFGVTLACMAQQETTSTSSPIELEFLKGSVGVWNAKIEVWPQGLDQDSIKFDGVEAIRPYGDHWIASDFDSTFMGQTTGVHSIVGYDLDKRTLVGMVIDHGPYAATMTGDYDPKSKTVTWMTKAKTPSGAPIVQKTSITQKSADQRVLVLNVPGKTEGEFTKFMEIRFTKQP